jgi:hypothetical protein
MADEKKKDEKAPALEGAGLGKHLRQDFADRQPKNFSPEYLSPNVNENQLGQKEVGTPNPQNPQHVGRAGPSAMELANADSKPQPAHDAREANKGNMDEGKRPNQ